MWLSDLSPVSVVVTHPSPVPAVDSKKNKQHWHIGQPIIVETNEHLRLWLRNLRRLPQRPKISSYVALDCQHQLRLVLAEMDDITDSEQWKNRILVV